MRLWFGITIVCTLLVAGACTSDDGGQAATTTEAPWTTAEDFKADPEQSSFGQEVTIEDGRVVPARLIAVVGNDVTFVNKSGQEVTVNFRNGPVEEDGTERSTGPIPPDGEFTFATSVTRSITYDVVGATATWPGHIQVSEGTGTL